MTRGFYSRWIVACAVGELIGIGTAAGVALLWNTWLGEPQSTAVKLGTLAVFAAVGIVEDGALALLQWRVLRDLLPRLHVGEWIAPTVAVAVIAWMAGMTPSLFMNAEPNQSNEPGPGIVLAIAAISGVAAGLCFGAAQWFVLRRHAENSNRWIWIHAPAWALAMTAIFLGASIPDADWPAWAIGVSGASGGVLGGVLLGLVTGIVARRLKPWVAEQSWSLRGKVCVVTGANSGIGREIAIGLARLGGTVVLLCRRPEEGERVRQEILTAHPNANVAVIPCDMAQFASIREAAARIRDNWTHTNVLIHNAGATFWQRTITVDGIEATLAVDVVGPFLLTSLLRDRLDAAGARVITLTGIYHRKGKIDLSDLSFERLPYDLFAANNQAQKGRWLFMSELARRAPRLFTASVHPGAVFTAAQARLPRFARVLIHTLARPAFVRAEVGAIPPLRLAAHPNPLGPSGRFFNRCRVAPDIADTDLARDFWTACEEMTRESMPAAR